jgi:uncharacterized protein (UPF0264 family)
LRLLVSVRSAHEARLALAGGADVIDVKDPSEGALGAPAPETVAAVASAVAGAAPISVALGDMPNLPHTAALAACGAVAAGADYVKVGLRGVRELDAAVALMRAVAQALEGRAQVIAAAYADAATLEPPALEPRLLPAVVAAAGLDGALIDTFRKDGRGLYAWLAEGELGELAARTRRGGATFAVAGQLRRGELARVPADLVGVRSAVCRGGRAGALDLELVAAAAAEVHGTRADTLSGA